MAADRGDIPDLELMTLFALGAMFMRGAGCTLNDIIDRKFDGLVDRTARRPIPSEQISVFGAVIFLVLQLLAGLWILLKLNEFAQIVGISSLVLVIIYPFMKRITYWPQFVLGLTFNWGALLGWAAVRGTLDLPAIYLYVGGVFWTLGYDTIYAHQDKEDDMMIGVKSTALLFGGGSKLFIFIFYVIAVTLFGMAGHAAALMPFYILALAATTIHLIFQIGRVDLDNSESCLHVFRSNMWTGWILFAGILGAQLL
jgi:4-hydroxybenzoate polyprenyltransferase